MKIYISKTVQLTDNIGEYLPVSEVSYDYFGPLFLQKGDPVAKQAEVQQMQFDSSLMTIFQAQYATQKNTLDYLKGKMQPQIDNPTGLSAGDLAAARTSSDDTLSAGYQNAQQALNAKMATSGESQLPSGVGAQLNSALLNAEAADKSTSQNQITMQNAQLKNENYWNSVNALNGVAAQNSPVSYASSATAGSGAVSGLSQAVTAANGPSFGQILGGALGGIGGATVGAAGKAGGFSSLFCWVAAKIYGGWNEPRTILVRNYLMFDFSQRWLVKLYSKYGEWVSNQPILVKLLTPAFNMALRSAEVTQ